MNKKGVDFWKSQTLSASKGSERSAYCVKVLLIENEYLTTALKEIMKVKDLQYAKDIAEIALGKNKIDEASR